MKNPALLTPPAHGAAASRSALGYLLPWAAWLGVAWNVFGVYQFVASLGVTRDVLMARGMDAAQATLYLGLPAWMTAVFAVGVFGGLLGSLALVARRGSATGLLAVSLSGYVLLFAGDAAFGLFAAIPGQLAVMGLVLLIAIGLLWLAIAARRAALLR